MGWFHEEGSAAFGACVRVVHAVRQGRPKMLRSARNLALVGSGGGEIMVMRVGWSCLAGLGLNL